ncbi:MAG: hypothetical protein RIM99_11030 [Cyclobacteriaceae bacterium]
MKKIILTALIATSITGYGQVGDQFPIMEAESLTNEYITLPEGLKDKFSIVGLAYTKASEDDLKTWFEPAYNQFIYKPETASVFDFSYDVYCYFVPMFTGAKRPAYQKVMKKLQKTIDKRLLPHVLFYKGALKTYKESLKFEGRDLPYFFVLDPSGKIVYATSGKYSKKKMQEIIDAVDSALKMK